MPISPLIMSTGITLSFNLNKLISAAMDKLTAKRSSEPSNPVG
jgi:hypothetical protein